MALSLSALASGPAVAALYKCAADKGVVYQDHACPPGRELRDLEADPATLSVVPGIAIEPAPRKDPQLARSTRAVAPRATVHRARGGSATERRFIRVGMSESEVVFRIGRPDVQARAGGKNGGRQWSYLPAAGDADTLTTLTLSGGKVVDVERRVAR
jgi:hypothetical protein